MKISNFKFQISNSRRGGFTLVEVIIAIAILGISLVMVMQLFAGGLRAARTSCDYSRAVIHAKDKMEEILIDPIQDSGSFDDGFKWEANVETYKEPKEGPFKLLQLKVKVIWDDVLKKPRTVELVGLKAVSEDNEE
ncbi:MAG: prepilin-type N-terminal cleavage/methylation domain-containing protein [Nitrospirae bacterium]|nr:prepilin-type N-terminal cleavage/methylation domain-containing protein [Nitrospirota bacterium]